MRCLFRIAGAMMAMICSSAALAGPVSIRTAESFSSGSAFDPAALVQADEQPVAEVEPLSELVSHLSEPPAAWFPQDMLTSSPPPVTLAAAQHARPPAIVIPLPAPACIGMAAMACALLGTRVFKPWLFKHKHR